MNRRNFLTAATAFLALPTFARAGTDYTPGLVEAELAAGKTVFLDFKAKWCSTCASQERTIGELRGENPAYGEAISFIDVDWDQFKRADLTKRLNIPRRSTLVVLRGDQEIGRLVADTRRDAIKGLMDAALAASTS